ncbi:class I SAM-dependent methyltransferase [Periweissella beninensis]|uniref:class I SAM-dependent methyltransferase n=1 Tax=Periweissella beninensis TaxID=504936 RepID=UPI0030B8372A
MTQDKVETLYKVLDQASQLLIDELDTAYFDALIEVTQDLLSGTIQVEDGKPSQAVVKRLQQLFAGVMISSLESETIRKAIGLALLRAAKIDKLQANHQLTPDMIGLIIGYLLNKLNKKPINRLFDVTVGTGNLLGAVNAFLRQQNKQPQELYGMDIDDTLLAMAGISFDLQQIPVNLFNDDATQGNLPTADAVISDLPLVHNQKSDQVDQNLISASIDAVVEGGFAIYVVPSNLLEGNQAKDMLRLITAKTYLQGFLKLPDSVFKNSNAQKAVLILQKQGGLAQQAKEVLIGQLPALKDTHALKSFFNDLDEWAKQLN